MDNLVVWVADVGSIRRGRFGYYGMDHDGRPRDKGTDIKQFVAQVIGDLRSHRYVALGFECPLFVPVSPDPADLTAGRRGESNRAWSATAGSTALATGLAEYAWVFDRLAEAIPSLRATLRWDHFTKGQADLFIWEAFVTAKAKAADHSGDAMIAAKAFWEWVRNPRPSDILSDTSFSLVGAALLRAGLLEDALSVLRETCLVIRGNSIKDGIPGTGTALGKGRRR